MCTLANKGSNLPLVVATDFFLKINAPVLAENSGDSTYPCYSAVSASLTKPLPDCSNYLPFCRTHYLILQINTSLVSQARHFTKPPRKRLILHCCCALLQNLSREFVSLEEYRGALRKLNNKQKQVVMFLLLFKLSSQLPFVSFSFLSISIPFLLPF